MNLFDKFKSKKTKDSPTPDTKPDENAEQELDDRGWKAITEAFEKLYPGQENPLHFGVLIPWELGGSASWDQHL